MEPEEEETPESIVRVLTMFFWAINIGICIWGILIILAF